MPAMPYQPYNKYKGTITPEFWILVALTLVAAIIHGIWQHFHP